MAPCSAGGAGCPGRPRSWVGPSRVGAGLRNLGNSCYANAALQCLTYTPLLAGYLLSRPRRAACPRRPPCALCALQAHVSRALLHPGEVVSPEKELLAGFHARRQEDAHEFLMFTVDAMRQGCALWPAHPQPGGSTLVRDLFGGCWRSQVRCERCRGVSTTLEPCLDIALDIQAADSVERALEELVKPERLAGADAYHCAVCGDRGPAAKTLALHAPPRVLVLVLKRFCGLTGAKVAKPVRYPQDLDLQALVSEQRAEALRYELYAVLVHAGWGCRQGHYFCYVRPSRDQWYRMDDSEVTACEASSALSQQAYVLFYIQKGALEEAGGPPPRLTSTGAGLPPGAHRAAAGDRPPAGPESLEPEQEAPTQPVTLDQWRRHQEQTRPKPPVQLREVDRALPANAVVIHGPRHPAGAGEASDAGRPHPFPWAGPAQGPAPAGRAPGPGGRASKGKRRKPQRVLLAF
ncbi:PREDICTED: ubiquitin carboxyl-terminal hydrolase 17-like protein 6 [Condylura cristata]|uniref:ubiquitin carboxyl-terminal hydrolase 17-like protein 6 n=1 Tax=Condylura cristata TaxID=143302 RepID=UPI0003346C97|nr:PREDICTED: ubiquitin carboxyl-terminal hydrolase 17-like protein 6 [Condylura cristata]